MSSFCNSHPTGTRSGSMSSSMPCPTEIRLLRRRDVPLPASDGHACARDSHRNGAPFTIPPSARGFIREKILAGQFVPYLAIDIREVVGRARKERAPTRSLCRCLRMN